MSLFENFPYTNLHELNLDWLIQEMEDLKELVQDGPVISVNGQTGVVTLYQEAQVRLPDVTDAQQTYWNIFRSLNGHLYGIRFDSNGNVYAIRDGINTKLLTWADIPADAGVISVNGLYGVVHISGTDIPWMGGENETVFDKLSENEDAIDLLNITLGTLSNAIKAGIAYLEPNVDDTAIHNIPAGRYVFWKNYAYKSTQAISIGDILSSTNLQAVGDGGFINALQAELQTQIDTLTNDITWKNGGSVTGNSVLHLPTGNWKEVCIIFACHGSDKKVLTIYIPQNNRAERRYSVVGYVSATELASLSWPGSARLLWISVYVNQTDFQMMEANSEETVNNYAMRVWYR